MPKYPNRCQHIKVNGVQCGSPALRRNRFCFFHKRFHDESIHLATDKARRGPGSFMLPLLEDANSIQIALMEVMRLLLARQIEHKTASLLLYALQTASGNLSRTHFDPDEHDIILDPRDAAITPLNYRAWEDHEFEEEEEEEENEDEDQDEEQNKDEDEDEQTGNDKQTGTLESTRRNNQGVPSQSGMAALQKLGAKPFALGSPE